LELPPGPPGPKELPKHGAQALLVREARLVLRARGSGGVLGLWTHRIVFHREIAMVDPFRRRRGTMHFVRPRTELLHSPDIGVLTSHWSDLLVLRPWRSGQSSCHF
jgi:hypothetical protein